MERTYYEDIPALAAVADALGQQNLKQRGAPAPAIEKFCPLSIADVAAAAHESHERMALREYNSELITADEAAEAVLRLHKVCTQHVVAPQTAQNRLADRVRSIQVELEKLQGQMTSFQDQMTSFQGQMQGQLTSLETRLKHMEERLAARFDGIDAKLATVTKHFESLEDAIINAIVQPRPLLAPEVVQKIHARATAHCTSEALADAEHCLALSEEELHRAHEAVCVAELKVCSVEDNPVMLEAAQAKLAAAKGAEHAARLETTLDCRVVANAKELSQAAQEEFTRVQTKNEAHQPPSKRQRGNTSK